MPTKITKVHSVRLDIELEEKISAIATAEERTLSNTIQRLLREAANRYLEAHPEIRV